MQGDSKYLIPLTAACTVAIAIAAVPAASATPTAIKTCFQVGPGSTCHVEVRNLAPAANHHRAADTLYRLGDN